MATIVCVVAFGPPTGPITWVADHTLPTRLHSLGDADVADFISQTGWQVGRVQSLGYDMLCLTRRGSVTIDKVTPARGSSGIAIDSFAVRPNPYVRGEVGLGLCPGDLRQNNFSDSRTVDAACRAGDRGGDELGVQLHTTSPVAHLTGLRMGYHIGNIPWSVTVRMDNSGAPPRQSPDPAPRAEPSAASLY